MSGEGIVGGLALVFTGPYGECLHEVESEGCMFRRSRSGIFGDDDLGLSVAVVVCRGEGLRSPGGGAVIGIWGISGSGSGDRPASMTSSRAVVRLSVSSSCVS